MAERILVLAGTPEARAHAVELAAAALGQAATPAGRTTSLPKPPSQRSRVRRVRRGLIRGERQRRRDPGRRHRRATERRQEHPLQPVPRPALGDRRGPRADDPRPPLRRHRMERPSLRDRRHRRPGARPGRPDRGARPGAGPAGHRRGGRDPVRGRRVDRHHPGGPRSRAHPPPRHGARHRRRQQGRQREARARRRRVPRIRLGGHLRDLRLARARYGRPARRDRLGAAAGERGRARAQGARGGSGRMGGGDRRRDARAVRRRRPGGRRCRGGRWRRRPRPRRRRSRSQPLGRRDGRGEGWRARGDRVRRPAQRRQVQPAQCVAR